MPFNIPANLEELYMAKSPEGKGHTPSTLKLYKTYLNKIAKQGYDTTDLLINNQKKVLDFVKTLDAKYQKSAMTSIFYALSGHENNAKNKGKYHKFYQELKKSDVKLQEYKAKKDI